MSAPELSTVAAGTSEPTAAAPRRRRVPAPLLALYVISVLVTSTWALVVPAFQNSDEPDHFSYVQTIGENGRLPGGAGQANSSEVAGAANATNLSQVTEDVFAIPEWSKGAADAFGDQPHPAGDGGGPNTASNYPPLYYAIEAVPYAAAKSGGVFTKLAVVRLTSGLWLLGTITGVWLLLGELFDRRRLPQTAGAATVAMWPTLTMVSASVNPDSLVVALWSFVFWLGVKVLRRGLTPRRGAALGLLVGAAAITKVSSLVLLPVLLGLVLVALFRSHPRRGAPLLGAGLAVALAAIPLAAWTLGTRIAGRSSYAQATEVSSGGTAGGGFDVREFVSYVWQFYLPRLDFMTPVHHQVDIISTKPVINLWLGTGTGTFGWVNVWFPKWVYWIVGVLVTAVFLVALVGGIRRLARRGSRLSRALPALLLAVVSVLTLGALHYTDYGFYADNKGLFMQGRYLLPLAGVLAAIVGLAVTTLPRRAQGAAVAIWVTLLLGLQVASFGLILARWYVA